MTSEELIERYLAELRARRRSPALCTNERKALFDFQSHCGLVFAEDIRLEHLLDYHRELPYRGLKASTSFNRVSSVRRWLKWAERRGHILNNPAADWAPRCPPVSFKVVPTVAQMVSLLEAPSKNTLSGRRDRVLFEFLYGTGLRINECADVDLSDLDLVHSSVTVRAGKGGKGRCLPLGPKLTELLREYLQEIRPQLEKTKTSALFLNDKGGPLRDFTIASRLKDYSRKACGVHLSAHAIRHAFATHLLLGQAPLWAVQKLMGHESLDSTIRYTHLLPLDLINELQRTHPRAKAKRRRGGKSA